MGRKQQSLPGEAYQMVDRPEVEEAAEEVRLVKEAIKGMREKLHVCEEALVNRCILAGIKVHKYTGPEGQPLIVRVKHSQKVAVDRDKGDEAGDSYEDSNVDVDEDVH